SQHMKRRKSSDPRPGVSGKILKKPDQRAAPERLIRGTRSPERVKRMARERLGKVLRHVRKVCVAPGAQGLGDSLLLQRYQAQQDEDAFAVLVQRHGRLVLGVCQRVLRHEQDAEDAFQAVFLALARCASSIRKPDALASWLHGVAYRTAMGLKRATARRRAHERRV